MESITLTDNFFFMDEFYILHFSSFSPRKPITFSIYIIKAYHLMANLYKYDRCE